ncbi:MAG: prolipoprotein diacylglyceryl transferase [Flavobacteriaceae bacterium]|nr:prolipoprotein diacylglyceryl transferase [Flavobacteriaceae bacterium]
MYFLSFAWDPSEGISLGFYTIQYYSLMFVISFIVGWFIMKKIYTNENVSLLKLDSLFIYMVLAILIGARLGHVIFYQSELITEDFFSIFLPISTVDGIKFTGFRGLASHGAAIGVIIAMLIYNKKVLKGRPILWILDRVVVPVAFGAILVRIGNFMNSEIIGNPTNSDFGVVFTKLGEDFPRHPAQLYEALGYVFVFLLLLFVYWKTEKSKQRGYIFGLFLVTLWSVRFIVEFFKKSQQGFEDMLGNTLSTGQWLSIPFIIAGVYFMWQSTKKKNG